MRATTPSSILVSLTLHALFAVVLILSSMLIARSEKAPVIFELVAGPPTAPGELAAPALGNSAKPVKQEVAKVEAPPVKTPPVAKPEPVKKETTKPDAAFKQNVKRAERTSYKDYLKKHPTPKPAATPPVQRAANVPRIDAQGIAEGVRGGSVANNRGGGGGKAMTREQQDELSTYISFLLAALKDAHEPPPGVSDRLEAKVTFDITASGAILYPRISKSSGDRAFDQSVIEAFRRVKSIGPTPNGKPDSWTVTFRMKDEN